MEYRKLNKNIIAVDYDKKELHIFDTEDELQEFEKNRFKLDRIQSELHKKNYAVFCKKGLEFKNEEIEKIEKGKIKKLWVNSAYFALPFTVSALGIVGHYACGYTLAPEMLALGWGILGTSGVANVLLDLITCTDAIDKKAIHELDRKALEKAISEAPNATEEEVNDLIILRDYYIKKNKFLENQARLPKTSVTKLDKEEINKELDKELEYYKIKEKKNK